MLPVGWHRLAINQRPHAIAENDGPATLQEMCAAATAKGYNPAAVSAILTANRGLFRRAKWAEWELAP